MNSISRGLVLYAIAFLLSPAMGVNVLVQHNDLARTGANTSETILTPANVNSTNFGKLFTDNVDAQVYAQPLYVQNLNIAGGVHDVVFVCTESNTVYAFDADTAGIVYWRTNLGAPFNPTPCGDLVPVVGITRMAAHFM
jgi:glucose dehydrogenase